MKVLRLLNRIILKTTQIKLTKQQFSYTPTSKLDMDPAQFQDQITTSFTRALELANLKQLEQSELYFQTIVQMIDSSLNDQYQTPINVDSDFQQIVYRKYSILLLQMSRNQKLIEILQKLYFVIESSKMSRLGTQSLPTLQNLLQQYIMHDYKQGLMFCQFIIEQQKQNMQLQLYIKQVYPYLGSLFILNQKYEIGLEYLQKSIKVQTNAVQKAILYNNMAICKYNCLLKRVKQAKSSLQNNRDRNSQQQQHQLEQIQKEYHQKRSEILVGLKKALNELECMDKDREKDQLDELEYKLIKKMVDFDNHDLVGQLFLVEKVVIKNKMSVKVIQNIGLFMFENQVYEQAQVWFKVAVSVSKQLGNYGESYLSVLYLAKILEMEDQEDKCRETIDDMYQDVLEMAESRGSKIVVLYSYICRLNKEGRKYEAEHYKHQILRLGLDSYDLEMNLLDQLLVPDYQLDY